MQKYGGSTIARLKYDALTIGVSSVMSCISALKALDSMQGTPLFSELGNSVYPTWSFRGDTYKDVGRFYLVSMPGEVKDPTQGA